MFWGTLKTASARIIMLLLYYSYVILLYYNYEGKVFQKLSIHQENDIATETSV